MLFNLLADAEKTTPWTSYILIILVVVVLVAFFVWSTISNKKKQKQFNDTINAIKPGNKVKTIGGVCGTVVSINEGDITFDKQAMYQTDAQPQPAVNAPTSVPETKVEEANAEETAAVEESAEEKTETEENK